MWDASLIPGSNPEVGNGKPLRYSCLENPMDRGAWRATVHGDTRELDTTEWLNNKTAPKNHDALPLVTTMTLSFLRPPSPLCLLQATCFPYHRQCSHLLTRSSLIHAPCFCQGERSKIHIWLCHFPSRDLSVALYYFQNKGRLHKAYKLSSCRFIYSRLAQH